MKIKDDILVGIIGLGYVGLPLALAFGNNFKTIGFDINQKRVSDLKSGVDETSEVSYEALSLSKSIEFTSEERALLDVNFYIVTVPTPIDEFKKINNCKPLACCWQKSRQVRERPASKSISTFQPNF